MDIIEYLKQEVELLGWTFNYGNKSNQNLMESDLEEGKIYFILDPVTTNEEESLYGGITACNYAGNFMLVMKSDLDETYEYKYSTYIKPLKTALTTFKDVLNCSDYQIKQWSYIELINSLDVNFDGLIVSFTLKS